MYVWINYTQHDREHCSMTTTMVVIAACLRAHDVTIHERLAFACTYRGGPMKKTGPTQDVFQKKA